MSTKKDAIDDALNAAAAVSPLVTANPYVPAGLALLGTAIEAYGKAAEAFRIRRFGLWWQEYVRSLGTMSPEGALTEAALKALEHDPQFQERMHEVLSSLWSALDEAVIPNLAYLAARYEAEGRPADQFYKYFARFLQESTSGELETLRTLLEGAETAVRAGSGGWFALIVPLPGQVLKFICQTASGEQHTSHTANASSNARQVIRRLLNLYLADESEVQGEGTPIALNLDQLKQLREYTVRPLVR